MTCYRLGIRMGHPEMPTLLVAHQRLGFYLRVLREGLVGARQDVITIAHGAEHLTVAEADTLLYQPNRSRDALRLALTIPALSRGWRESFHTLLDQPPGGVVSRAAWEGFQPMRVVAKQRESATITSLYLLPVDGTPVALPGER